MIVLECQGIHVVGSIQPVSGTAIGMNAIRCRDEYLVNFMIGSVEKDPGFYLGTPACHPAVLMGYQLKLPVQQEGEADCDVIPNIIARIRNIGFFLRAYGNSPMVELALGVFLRDDSYVTAGLWANHTYSPFGRQAAPRVGRLFHFFNSEDLGLRQKLGISG